MYESIQEKRLFGRYVNLEQLQVILTDLKLENALVSVVGHSVENREIYQIKVGTGSKKVLMWSQMHGNESTTTKAVFDLLNYLKTEEGSFILQQCTLIILPMLNPDGAQVYTRENANKVDLNRDAKALSQPESQVLRTVFKAVQPDFCFNLHDQRTLYNVGNSDKPATISFLSPSANTKKEITPSRVISMKLIVAMTNKLHQLIPEMIGRYDDTFNINCVGDTFQNLEIPTILFESGHYPNDYEREKTRMYIFYGIVECLKVIAEDLINNFEHKDYFSIPENGKQFMDIIIKNVSTISERYPANYNIGIQYVEELLKDEIMFKPTIVERGELLNFYGHEVLNCTITKDRNKILNKIELLNLIR